MKGNTSMHRKSSGSERYDIILPRRDCDETFLVQLVLPSGLCFETAYFRPCSRVTDKTEHAGGCTAIINVVSEALTRIVAVSICLNNVATGVRVLLVNQLRFSSSSPTLSEIRLTKFFQKFVISSNKSRAICLHTCDLLYCLMYRYFYDTTSG
jgi:hypothetical protein